MRKTAAPAKWKLPFHGTRVVISTYDYYTAFLRHFYQNTRDAKSISQIFSRYAFGESYKGLDFNYGFHSQISAKENILLSFIFQPHYQCSSIIWKQKTLCCNHNRNRNQCVEDPKQRKLQPCIWFYPECFK